MRRDTRLKPRLLLLLLSLSVFASAAPRLVELPGKSPLITVRIVFTTGAASDPQDKPGLAHLTSELLGSSGTKDLTYKQLVDTLYPMAASIRDEITMQVHTSGKSWTTILGLTGNPLEWMKYWGVQSAWLFHQVFVEVSPKEHALIKLPERLRFLYHVIRPARLMVRYIRRARRNVA